MKSLSQGCMKALSQMHESPTSKVHESPVPSAPKSELFDGKVWLPSQGISITPWINRIWSGLGMAEQDADRLQGQKLAHLTTGCKMQEVLSVQSVCRQNLLHFAASS